MRVMLAARGRAIMAGRAVVDDTGMVEHRTDEGRGVMAHPAVLQRFDMTARFRRREPGRVAGGTIIDDAPMLEYRRQESGGLVAEDAALGGRHVVRWRDLARRRAAIVTTRAVVADAAVVEAGAGKGCRNMAGIAIARGRDVRRVGLGVLAGGRASVMTGIAAQTTNLGHAVFEHGGCKGAAGQMTNLTIVGGRHMGRYRGALADGIDPVMTGIATLVQDLGTAVINKRRSPRQRW